MSLEEFLTESQRPVSPREKKVYDWLLSKKPEDNSSVGLWAYRGALLASCAFSGLGGIHPRAQDALCDAGRMPKQSASLVNAISGYVYTAAFGVAVLTDLPLGDALIEDGVNYLNQYMVASHFTFACTQTYFALVKKKSSWSFGGFTGLVTGPWKMWLSYRNGATLDTKDDLSKNSSLNI